MLRPIRTCMDLSIPVTDGATIARVRAIGQVDEEQYVGDTVHLKARIPPQARGEFTQFENKAE